MIELLYRRIIAQLHRLERSFAVGVFYFYVLIVGIGYLYALFGRKFFGEFSEKFSGNESFSLHSYIGVYGLLYGEFGIRSGQREEVSVCGKFDPLQYRYGLLYRKGFTHSGKGFR